LVMTVNIMNIQKKWHI